MPRKKRKRVSEKSDRRARDKDAASTKARRHVRTIDRGVRGRFFPPRLASRPRPDRFRSLRPLEEAQAPPPTLEAKDSMRTPRQRLRLLQRQRQRPPALTAPRSGEATRGATRGGDSGGGASADRYRAAGDDGAAATPPWAAAQLDSADGKEAELPRPPGSDPGAGTARAPASSTWLYRGCGRAHMQFGDPVTLQCQHRAGRQAGCCWHTAACLHTVLILPHSRCACPQHGVHPIGRGLGRYDDVDAATTPAATSSRVPR